MSSPSLSPPYFLFYRESRFLSLFPSQTGSQSFQCTLFKSLHSSSRPSLSLEPIASHVLADVVTSASQLYTRSGTLIFAVGTSKGRVRIYDPEVGTWSEIHIAFLIEYVSAENF